MTVPGRRTRLLVCAVLLLAVFPTARVARPWILGSGVSVCPFRTLTGRPCVFCGLTRAFAHASGGEFGRALGCHPLWWAAAALIAAAALTCLVDAVTGSRHLRHWKRFLGSYGWRLVAVLALVTLLRALLSDQV